MTIVKKGLTKVLAFALIPGVVYFFFFCLRPNVYGSLSTIYMLFTQSITTVIMAWGMSFGMTAGNIDFSLGAEVAMGTIVGALFAKTMGIPGIVLGTLLVAVVVGVLKSIVTGLIKMSSMVISIAYTLIIGSFGSVLCSGKSLIIQSNQTLLGREPYNLIIFAFAGIVIYILQKYSTFGAKCRALGGSKKLATSAGISEVKVTTATIMIGSFFAAMVAIISLSYGAGASPSTGLASMGTVFNSMIAFFIAGILSKYINTVFGIIAGSITMNIISMGLLSINMPSNLNSTITGAFLLILMTISYYLERSKAMRMRRQASLLQIERAQAGSAI